MIDILGKESFETSTKSGNSQYALNYGRKLETKKVIHGRISKAGNSFIITLEMLDVGTGVVEATETQRIEGSINNLLDEIENVTCSLLQQYFRKRN